MARENNDSSRRPWGYYEVLSDERNHKVKRITVYPEKRLSLQIHKRRSEHWFIVQGTGVVTINGKDSEVCSGQSLDIKKETSHRIKNTGQADLIYIEVQTGDYFGEDDIVRIEDDYGRVSPCSSKNRKE